MSIAGLNHFTILTDDVETTVKFYGELMGLAAGPRPPLNFPGAWLYAGSEAVLHIIGGRPKDELKAGVIDHMAFSASGLQATLAALEARGVKYDCRRQSGSGTWQVFFFDPNGAKVELDFSAEESPSR
jgi:catechol 2,3-dioxygenase-like lactoylglutathione lyase family enzyme